ncbi:MAG: hypothetical protein KF819_32025, partial [Labilithrix sp.]|nr:hypothetical protein [Labilithrix sp.]
MDGPTDERARRSVTELSSSDLIEDERASLVSAALNARSAAMLTGTHGVVALPLDRAAVRLPAARDLLAEGASFEAREGESEATALLRARVAAVDPEDPVGRMRAHLELAQAAIDEGDLEAARASADAARRCVEHAPAAHALLRVLSGARDRIDAQLEHVEHLASHVADDLVRADFLAERGRLLEARSGPSVESAAAFGEALALAPDHAGALSGIEAAFDATARWSDLAAHLGRLAGLAGDPAAAAWLHVERAWLLDRRLGDSRASRAALEHALELAGGLGPVRQACVDHAVAHRDDAWLAALL